MSTVLKSSAMLIVSAMAAATGGVPVTRAEQSEPSNIEQAMRSLRFLGFGSGTAWGRFNYPRGPGWTRAQVKRMARKAKNRRRHKAAVKKARA